MQEKKAQDEKPIRKSIVKEDKVEAIWIGTATTCLTSGSNPIDKGEKVKIFEDKGDEWLTEKGRVSKLFMLLEKVK